MAVAQAGEFTPLTQDMLNDPDPNDWLMWRGNYQNWGYSPLDQITADNVNDLRMVWSYALPPGNLGAGGMQAEPVVYDGVLYLRHANGNYSAPRCLHRRRHLAVQSSPAPILSRQ